MPLQFAEVKLPSSRTAATLRKARIIQAEYKHEVAVLTYDFNQALKTSCVKGAPVTITWGLRAERSVLRGYVHHTATEQRAVNGRTQQMLDVVVIGASDSFNAPDHNTYRAARADAVVSDLARRNSFSVLLERHPYVWELIQQQGESSWAFMVATAKKIGWTLYARDTDIRCHSRAIRYAGALAFRNDGAAGLYRSQAVTAFSIVEAETLAAEAKKRQRIATGVDDYGNVYTVATGTQNDLAGVRGVPASLTEYRTLATRSVSETQATLRGEQELNRHYIRAKATTTGHAGLFPTRTVRLVGVSDEADGHWFTTRAEHVLTESDYQVALELGKDSLGDVEGVTPALKRVMPGDTRGRVVIYDPTRGGGSIEALRQAAPDPTYADFDSVIPSAPITQSSRWRSSAPIERFVSPVNRSPRRSA